MTKLLPALLITFCCMISITVSPATAGVTKITVVYSWDKKQQPSSPVSPELKLEGVPSETKEFKLSLSDRDRPMNDHGEGTVAYDGPGGKVTIEKGVVAGLRGPAPPWGERHTYIMKVECLDKDGRILASGEGAAMCCN